jgi:hypothetical protein
MVDARLRCSARLLLLDFLQRFLLPSLILLPFQVVRVVRVTARPWPLVCAGLDGLGAEIHEIVDTGSPGSDTGIECSEPWRDQVCALVEGRGRRTVALEPHMQFRWNRPRIVVCAA